MKCPSIYDFLQDQQVNRLTRYNAKKLALLAYYKTAPIPPADKGMAFLSFDCDYRRDMEAIPKLLDILNEFGLKASFACVGRWIEEFPREHRLILEAGHEILNHTYSHPNNEELNPRKFHQLSRHECREEIAKFTRVCENILGYRPVGFRTPHFGPQHRYQFYEILEELGYGYSSSVASLGLPGHSTVLALHRLALLEFPLSSVPGCPRAVFDSWNYYQGSLALAKRGHQMAADFRALIEVAARPGGYLNVYFDPADATERPEYLDMFHCLKEVSSTLISLNYSDLLIDPL